MTQSACSLQGSATLLIDSYVVEPPEARRTKHGWEGEANRTGLRRLKLSLTSERRTSNWQSRPFRQSAVMATTKKNHLLPSWRPTDWTMFVNGFRALQMVSVVCIILVALSDEISTREAVLSFKRVANHYILQLQSRVFWKRFIIAWRGDSGGK